MLVPLAKNCTETMLPSGSLALADNVTGEPTRKEVPVLGAVTETIGGSPMTLPMPPVPPLVTFTLTAAEVLLAPAESVASAVMVDGIGRPFGPILGVNVPK